MAIMRQGKANMGNRMIRCLMEVKLVHLAGDRAGMGMVLVAGLVPVGMLVEVGVGSLRGIFLVG